MVLKKTSFTKLFLISMLSISHVHPEQKPAKKNPAAQSTQGSAKLSLDQIYTIAYQAPPEQQIPTRSKSITPAKKTTDRFTQSQAHMSVPEVQKLIKAKYDTKPYQKLIDQMLAAEKKYADYYVFYHGLDNVWRLAQDAYTRLYAHVNNLSAQDIKDFVFLRFNGLDDLEPIDNLLATYLTKSGLINDHSMGADIIAVNLALFGNVGTDPECAWQYFIKSRNHTNPNRQIYEKMMDKFGLPHKYIDELMGLTKLYESKNEMIAQIFVPKGVVNRIGYLAWIRGIPADQEFMHTVLKTVKDKKFSKTAPALDYYSTLFKQEQDKNTLFKNMMERVKKGEFSLNYFLTFYRNRPNDIEDINNFQARLFLTHDVILNPLSGVKIFRYSMSTDNQLQQYHQKLDDIVKKIVEERR